MKKLYHVNIETDLFVMAENEEEAKREAKHAARHDLEVVDGGWVKALEVTTRGSLEGWDGCIPYGADTDETVDQLMAKLPAPKDCEVCKVQEPWHRKNCPNRKQPAMAESVPVPCLGCLMVGGHSISCPTLKRG